MSTTPEHSERRRFRRILFDAPVTIEIGDTLYHSHLIDISFKGSLLQTPADWPRQDGGEIAARITIQLDAKYSVIAMEGHIAHQEATHIGFQCVHIDMDSITHLRRLVELNLGDPKLLERELSALG
jgi:hypothetical protein